jgi:hypothetical protein
MAPYLAGGGGGGYGYGNGNGGTARRRDLSAGLERLLAREQLQSALGAAAPAIVLGVPLPAASEWPLPLRLRLRPPPPPPGHMHAAQSPVVVRSWEELMAAALAAALAEVSAARRTRHVLQGLARRCCCLTAGTRFDPWRRVLRQGTAHVSYCWRRKGPLSVG